MSDLSLTGAALHGEAWRLWSGHLVHWGTGHLALNLVAMVPPLVLLRRRETSRIALWLLAAAPLVSFSILVSGVAVYRGASSLVVGFWCAAALTLWRRRDPVPALVLLGLVAAKLSLEAWGVAIFPQDGYYVVPLAHQAGAMVGLGIGGARGRLRSAAVSAAVAPRPAAPSQRGGETPPQRRARRPRSFTESCVPAIRSRRSRS